MLTMEKIDTGLISICRICDLWSANTDNNFKQLTKTEKSVTCLVKDSSWVMYKDKVIITK